MKNRFLVLLLSFSFLLVPGLLHAQTKGASTSGGSSAAGAVPASNAVKISKIQVTGNRVLTEKDFAPVLRKYEGRALTLSDLKEAAIQLTELYHSRGYVLATVYLPEQKTEGGVVAMKAVEGKIAKVDIKGKHPYYSESFIRRQFNPVMAAPAFNQADLERALLDLNQLPRMHATALLVPGEAPGTSNIEVTAECGLPVTGAVEYNNFGQSYAGGRDRGGVTFNVGNLPIQGSVLTLRGVAGEHPNEFTYGRVDYAVPIDGKGTRLGAYYQNGNFDVGGPLAVLGFKGRSSGFGMYATHPFIQTRLLSLTGTVGWDWIDAKETVFDGPTLNQDKILAARVGLDMSKSDLNGNWAASLYVTQGVGHFLGAMEANDPTASRPGADNNFTKFTLDAARFQKIAKRVFLLLKGSGQYATNPLVVSEEYSLGGEGSVRGFQLGESLGDYGYALTAEGRFAPLANTQLLQLALFVDNGSVYRKQQAPGESKATSLTGWGYGVRLNLPIGLQVIGDVGYPIHPSETVDGKSTMYYLQALWTF
ncbi:MAG: BamA/TamA family outer membrane protein [Nitrospiraceae bacterium]|nr:BamA/TamA family outer membrane protein [Nitrospiraceae bacterium]